MTDETLLVLGVAVSFIFFCGCYVAARQSPMDAEFPVDEVPAGQKPAALRPELSTSVQREVV